MKYFPLFMDLQGRNILVVGGGEKAIQKLRLLGRTDARIAIISSSPSPALIELTEQRGWALARRNASATDITGKALVIGADDEPDRNLEVAAHARAQGVPVNVVDAPDLSTFVVPAIVDRDPVIVAIGTEGAAPVIARDLRARIESWLPAAFGKIASSAAALRPRVKAEIADPRTRRQFWERLLRGPFRARTLAGDAQGASAQVDRELQEAASDISARGRVGLVGCGPGDPDLLTLKALQWLQDADVLVHDRLINPAILDYARRDAVRIDVGKNPNGKSTPQAEINRILVREALKGNRVARLKGGDVMIFGRAAEEIASVRAAGIEVDVIPGITAAHAIGAKLALPLTLRGKVRQFSVITGATQDGEPDLDWQALATPGQAFAIYMGVRNAPAITGNLLRAGARPDTPVVIVENGTLADELAIETTLADLPAAMLHARITGPAIIYIGINWQQANLSRPESVRTFSSAEPANASEHTTTRNRETVGGRT
jgi:uroporphyrin-III C-methyltransferase/precorrin-2 dehydrogenase/sirohydrochlorin ferrochelatase